MTHMFCLEDGPDYESVCYEELGHEGDHVWSPTGVPRWISRLAADDPTLLRCDLVRHARGHIEGMGYPDEGAR